MDVNIISNADDDLEIPVFGPDEGRRRWRRIRELIYDRQIDCLLIGGSTYNYRAGYSLLRY
jgi:hypothetical protein